MKNLYLIDANSLIHRAFHALPPFSNKKGEPTGALYGLSNILLKILREDSPDYIMAFFDRPEPTFRKKIFNDYKIHRPKAPDELISQIVESRNLFKNFGIKTFEAAGFEADDLIGTAAEMFKDVSGLKITILTGDLDSLQLVKNDKIVSKTLKKGVSETETYNENTVVEKYGIVPEQIPLYKALVGDPSDNIPGISGIGPKTASILIKKYGDMKNILEKGGKEKAFEKIFGLKDKIELSLKLATIEKAAPLEIKDLEEIKSPDTNLETLIPYFEEMGFKSLIKRIVPSIEKKPGLKSKNINFPQTLF